MADMKDLSDKIAAVKQTALDEQAEAAALRTENAALVTQVESLTLELETAYARIAELEATLPTTVDTQPLIDSLSEVDAAVEGIIPNAPPPPPPPPDTLYPERPAAYTQSTEINFSQVPLINGQVVAGQTIRDDQDNPIPGTDWNMIFFGSNWSKISDPSAEQSPPDAWQGRWAPGSYGGGVIGAGSGHGIGNVFTYKPGGAKRLYGSLRCYFDFDVSQWHPISNKFVNIETDAGLLLIQLRESGHWRHAEELAGTSFWVDNDVRAGELHIPGQIANPPVPNKKWTRISFLIDLPGKIFKVWQDGLLTTDAKPNFAATEILMLGIYAFRGGGGETLTTELRQRYDHFFAAW